MKPNNRFWQYTLVFQVSLVLSSYLAKPGYLELTPPGSTDHSAGVNHAPQSNHKIEFSNSKPPPLVSFEHLTVEDGLPSNRVRCILQDAWGYMWFGTDEGLAKYDGYGFKVYGHNPDDPSSLKENRIEVIYEDHSSTLWVATHGGWLERFDRDKDDFEHFELPSTVRRIYEDSEGIFWIGTDDPGLLRFDRDSGEFDLAWGGDRVGGIFEDQDGVLWAGNRDGLFGRYDRELDQFLEFDLGYWIEDILGDDAGSLWIGTIDGGLARFHQETGDLKYFRHDPDDPGSLGSDMAPRLHIDSKGVLWVGAYRGSLDRFESLTSQFVHYQKNPADSGSLSDDQILAIYEDRSGVFWVGTEIGGVNKLNLVGKSVSHFRHIPNDVNSLVNNSVTSCLQDQKGLLWVGTRGGLSRFDRSQGQWRSYRYDPENPNSVSGDYISTIYEDRSGVLWIGSAGGLDRYDSEIDQFVRYPVIGIYGIYQDSFGTLWVTAKDGLFQFDQGADKFISLRDDLLSKNDYWSMWIWEDQNSKLWIGTAQSGLGRYDPMTGEWYLYQHDPADPQSLSHNFVESLLEDQSGLLWIGTHGGLNRFDYATGSFKRYRMSDGLPSDTIFGILEDGAGYLWLSTNKGLSRFDPQTETFRNYDAGDGLQGSQFSRGAFYQSTTGEMFFGGTNGLNAFYPEQITDNLHPPTIVITAISLFNQVIRTDLRTSEHLEFEYKDNFLSFDFASLDYNNPKKNLYAYQMVGIDSDWVQAGNRRHADYPNLRPGNYTFRVIGSNNDGVWNENGASVAITIQLPFWETPWFIGLVIAALTSGGYGAYRYRIRSLRERSLQLEKEVAERTTELQSANLKLEREITERERVENVLTEKAAEAAVAEERNRLARELHDAVTQTLFSASLLAEALPNSWEKDPEDGRQLLTDIRQLNRGALAEMRTLLHELRPTTITETPLSELLHQLALAVTGREGIPVDVQINCQCELPVDLHVALYRIAQESLNNIVKHARATETSIELECSECEGDVSPPHMARKISLMVVDNGRGFDLQKHEVEGMGLDIMRERAESVGVVLKINTKPGDGTRIEVVWEDGEKR